MKQTSIRFNLKPLEDLRAAVGSDMRARVGILGSTAARQDEESGLNNAELGLIQLVGSDTHNIPPRDWLLMPIQKNQRQLLRSMATSVVKRAMEAANYKNVFLTLGALAKGFISEGFETHGWGQWAPNKPSTIKRKGSSAPLIETRQLARAVTYDVAETGKAEGAL